jgi:hypothetical protein
MFDETLGKAGKFFSAARETGIQNSIRNRFTGSEI